MGRELAEHALRAKIDLAAFPDREATSDVTFIDAHLYETHDIWHVVTGLGTDVAGELGVLACYVAQLPSRLGLVLIGTALLQTWLSAFDERDVRMEAIVRGWLLGRRAKLLLGVDWKQLWSTPLEEVRVRLGVDIAFVDATLRHPSSRTRAPAEVRVQASA